MSADPALRGAQGGRWIQDQRANRGQGRFRGSDLLYFRGCFQKDDRQNDGGQMTREQLMSKPATLSKLMVIGLLGALSLLLVEIRFEHREALGEDWQSWIPLLYS